MPAPLPLELRQRILDALHAGQSPKEVAKRFSVHHASVRRLRHRFETEKTIEPHVKRPGPAPTLTPALEEKLAGWLKEQPDLFERELTQRLSEETGVVVNRSCIGTHLRRCGLTRKTIFAAQQRTERVQALTETFVAEVVPIPIEDLVFLDETGSHVNMTRTHARAPVVSGRSAKKRGSPCVI